MSQEGSPTFVTKKRQRRGPEMVAHLIWEAEQGANVAEICRGEIFLIPDPFDWAF